MVYSLKQQDQGTTENIKYNIGYFIISFIIVFALSFIVLLIVEKEVRSLQFLELKKNEDRIVSLESDYLGKELSTVLADLQYLNHAFESQLSDMNNYNEISNNWKEFSTQRNIYDQIRFIDALGDEKIRINVNENGGYIVPQSELQNKKDRYYFYETIELPDDSVHISPLDLNIEQEKIEEPYKPMIRFSTPLYDEKGKLRGIIILNYRAKSLIESFRDLADSSRGDLVLLNSKGYWLSSIDTKQEWNFMFADRKNNTFKSVYPKEWDVISTGKGQSITDNGLFTYSSVNLQYKMTKNNTNSYDQSIHFGDGNWYIVSTVLRDGPHKSLFIDNLWALMIDVLIKNRLYFLMVFVISIIVAVLVYVNRKTYLKIKYYSEVDPLTKVYNRRAGIDRLNQMVSHNNRKNGVISLCFIDVNGLKQVNDTLGHRHGDELITTIVNGIKTVIREYDFVMRLGGDEFLIILNDTDTETSEKVWERIVNRYEKINNTENRPYIVSVSHGIVSHDNTDKSQVDDLIKLADEKMYEEKRVIKEQLNVIRNR